MRATIRAFSILLISSLVFSFQIFSQTTTEFRLKYSDEVSMVPITGRVILIISNDTLIDPDIPDPFHPFITFGMDFKNWMPGKELYLNNDHVDCFLSTIGQLEGYYSLRAIVDIDSTSSFLYRDGTCYSDKIVFQAEPNRTNVIDIDVNNVLSGFGFNESENIKLLKVESQLLSDFYTSPTYIEAAIILPDSYPLNPDKYYPTVFVFPGWGSTHTAPTQSDFQQIRYGMSGYGEEKVFVFLNQDCRFGFHVFADSENNGPRASSFISEFIPVLEKEYRVVNEANARFLVGQSSGAWAALWLLINYPDTFGMAWAGSPDPVDFRDFVGHDLYARNANMFYDSEGNLTPSFRTSGKIFTTKDWSDMETAVGEGGQYQSFEAVFGKRDCHQKPEQLFDRKTGAVSPLVIEHWMNYDLNLVIQERSEELRPKLSHKINIIVAENDDFYLDGSVRLFKETLEDLGFKANIQFLKEGGHNIWSDDIRTEMHIKMDEIYSCK